MLHSRQRSRRPRQSANLSSREDPYAPTAPDYAQRHDVFTSEIADIPGLVRVDIGAPAPKPD
jgi:hypothetical protein